MVPSCKFESKCIKCYLLIKRGFKENQSINILLYKKFKCVLELTKIILNILNNYILVLSN